MNKISPLQSSDNFDTLFAQLNPQDVEEFYREYQCWNMQHQLEMLHVRISDVRKQISENTERIQETQPTAIELATLARLQSNGVSDIDLLDRMLERGEMWLDRTMQRLDYLEQLDDFIRDDYTQWCQHALEGAYDWIDSVLDSSASSQPKTTADLTTIEEVQEEELINATEELFLQKISTDEEESLVQEITMKRLSITTDDLEEVVHLSEDTHSVDINAPNHENSITTLGEANSLEITVDTNEMLTDHQVHTTRENNTPAIDDANQVDTTENTHASKNEDDTGIEFPGSEQHISVESSATSIHEQPPLQESEELAPVAQPSSPPQTDSTFEQVAHKRPGLMKRFLGKVWGS
ncbi:MAG: hypothetical protein ACXVDN_03920 [Ktedonobacteraceae bacterium]